MRLLVLAIYYFMKIGVGITNDFAMTKGQEEVLLSVCEDIRLAKEKSSLSKKPSKVVILRIRVPDNLITPLLEHEKETGTKAYQENDSGTDDVDCEPNDAVAATINSAKLVAFRHQAS
jgi:hypothetical protein